MPDRSDELQARVEALAQQLRRIEARLESLEARPAPETAEQFSALPPVPRTEPSAIPPELSQGTLALMGRTLVALAGGYLIRAMTDAGLLPALGGVALGLAYAVFWIVMADRSAAAGQRLSAAFHGLASGLIAYPLLWETTTRFGLLKPSGALAILVLVFGAGIAVAARRHLSSLAWISGCLALGTAAGLFVATRHMLAAVVALLAIAAVVEWLASRDFWLGLRWPTALVLDTALLVMVLLGSRSAGLPQGFPGLPLRPAVAAALALSGIYLTSIVGRTLRRGCPVTLFELAQGTIALILSFGGAWRLMARQGAAATAIGSLSLLLGGLCYAAAFAFVERHKGHCRNFYFYSTAGGILALFGSGAILGVTPLAVTWCLLALGCAWLGCRLDRMTLRFHSAVYLCAAVVEAGLVGASWRDFFAPAAGDWTLPTPAGWITSATGVACYCLLARDRAREARWWERLPRGIVAATAAWTLGGTLVAALVVAVKPFAPAGPAAVSTVRTGVLAFLVLGLAWAARRCVLPELAWFVYPLLAIGGLKLLSEDLRQGRPVTLFLSLVFYGGALIAAPRLLKRSEWPAGLKTSEEDAPR